MAARPPNKSGGVGLSSSASDNTIDLGVSLKVGHEAHDLKAAMKAQQAVKLHVPIPTSRTEPPNPDLEFRKHVQLASTRTC